MGLIDHAALQPSLSEIESLVELGAQSELAASQTMLDIAAGAGFLHIVDFVLDRFPVQHGDSPRVVISVVLHPCTGDRIVLEIVHRFTATDVFGVNHQSPSGETFLGNAMRREHIDLVEDICLSRDPRLVRLSSVDDAITGINCR
jgi:hypothetical protein